MVTSLHMRIPCLWLWIGLALMGALAGGCSAAAVQPPGLPPGVQPLPPGSAGRWQALEREVAKYRGLSFKRSVPSGVIDEAGLRAKLAEEFRRELPAEKLKPAESSLKAFGLLPDDYD